MYNNSLEQYYTHKVFGALIASNFRFSRPKNILELGIGKGTLVGAIKKRWQTIDVVSTDVDKLNFLTAKTLYPEGKHFHFDAIDDNLPDLMGVKELSIDIAVCNPPYTVIEQTAKTSKILEFSGFRRLLPPRSEITADLVFLAQNIRFLRPGGELGIIVPDGLLTGHNYQWLRSLLIADHCIFTIIDLPEKIFMGTEAKTHVLMIRKAVPANDKIKILKADASGKIADEIMISSNDAVHRMDFNYHKWRMGLQRNKKGLLSLESVGADIRRGSYSRKELISAGVEHFHTTDFKFLRNCAKVVFKPKKILLEGLVAEPGDIILSRVGKRCLNQVALVEKGKILLSDCVYRIRVPSSHRQKVFDKLRSEEGRRWALAHAHGVCAKVISKRDLQEFKF